MLFINKPLPLSVAFKSPVPDVRTTLKEFPYCKKLEALKKCSKFVAVGLPNVSTKSFSEEIETISSVGPFVKSPAIAPIDVATAGITFVKSFSCTKTPGET